MNIPFVTWSVIVALIVLILLIDLIEYIRNSSASGIAWHFLRVDKDRDGSCVPDDVQQQVNKSDCE